MRRSRAAGCLLAVLVSQTACGRPSAEPSDAAPEASTTPDAGPDETLADVRFADADADSDAGAEADAGAPDAIDATDGRPPADVSVTPDALVASDGPAPTDSFTALDATSSDAMDATAADEAPTDDVLTGDLLTEVIGDDDDAERLDGASSDDASDPPMDVGATTDATTDATDAGTDAARDGSHDAPPATDAGPDVRPVIDRPVVFVLRVGTGLTPLTAASAAVYLEQRLISDGSPVDAPRALPATRAGVEYPFSLTGASISEGGMSRTANGRYVVFAGYGVPPGTADVATSNASVAPRVIARVDATGDVDTSTALGGAFDGQAVRSAASRDGVRLYAAGAAGTGAANDGGAWSALLGGVATQVLATPSNVRQLGVYDDQLYGSASTTGFVGLFFVTPALPTTSGAAAAMLPGFPAAGAVNSYSFTFVRRAAGVGGPDTIYVADDRSISAGGGVQRWTLDDGVVPPTWALSGTFNAGLAQGVRGVTALAPAIPGGAVTVVAVTGENPTRLISYSDSGAAPASAALRVLATAGTNTAFRGVALAPVL